MRGHDRGEQVTGRASFWACASRMTPVMVFILPASRRMLKKCHGSCCRCAGGQIAAADTRLGPRRRLGDAGEAAGLVSASQP